MSDKRTFGEKANDIADMEYDHACHQPDETLPLNQTGEALPLNQTCAIKPSNKACHHHIREGRHGNETGAETFLQTGLMRPGQYRERVVAEIRRPGVLGGEIHEPVVIQGMACEPCPGTGGSLSETYVRGGGRLYETGLKRNDF